MSTQPESILVRTSPEEQGVDSVGILKFIEAIENSGQELHSLMLLRHGCVVAEAWWSPYAPQIPRMMFSISKSFTSTAVGMAVNEGFFSVEDAVISFFPDALPDTLPEDWADMRVRHLLTMSTGHNTRTFPAMYEKGAGNWAKGFFEVPLVYKPGTQFSYNTGASYMLSEIVQRTTGMKLMDFLTPRLFEPLGIQNATWLESPHGVNLGGVGLSIKTEDIARFGQLYLQKGIWHGKRLLTEAWINEATSAHVSNGTALNSDWAQGYGYQFWRCQHGFYRADGSFGQFCIVMDAYDAVLALTAAAKHTQQILTLVWEHLLPAMHAQTRAQDSANSLRLLEKTASLHYPPLHGQATSPQAAQISGKTYIAVPNALGIESLLFEFTENTATIKMRTKWQEEIIIAPFGKWQAGQAALFDEIWLIDSVLLVASGAWVDDNRYIIMARLYETPYIYTLTCHFEGTAVTMTVQINVSLMNTEPHIITANLLESQ